MDPSRRFFEDLAKAASGAASAFSGIKSEIESLVRQQMERLLGELDVVQRDEFEATKAMAAKARAGQEDLERRVEALEARIGIKKQQKPRPTAKRATKTGTKAKKSPRAGEKRPAARKTKSKPRAGT
ncbi:MAG: accessory factor UbiK family protein [Rhodospirillales bacterium]